MYIHYFQLFCSTIHVFNCCARIIITTLLAIPIHCQGYLCSGKNRSLNSVSLSLSLSQHRATAHRTEGKP